MIVRLSLASMSAVEGLVLVRYQGARARCSATSVGLWPWSAYQTMVRLMQSRPNGTVRLTASSVRLRASPTPTSCLASSKVTSIDQRQAKRSTSSTLDASRSVEMSASS